MKAFDYERPTSIEDACRLLADAGGRKMAMAGGTDLLVKIRHRALAPEGMVSLRDVPGLSFVDFDPREGLSIGAATKLIDVEESEIVREHYPALAEATATIGSTQVRNRGSIGGNICNAAPSADTPPILIAYGASAVITDGTTERTVPLEDFFTGPGTTVLKPGELLKAVVVPPPAPNTFAIYLKAARSGLDIAMVGLALAATVDPESGVCTEIRVVAGAVAPVPIRSKALEAVVRGAKPDAALIDRAVSEACTEACPITDVRSTESYRNTLVEVFSRRALEALRSWLEKGGVQ